MRRLLVSPSVLLAALLLHAPAFAQDATVPGAVSSPYPTFENLAIEWLVDGDDNENGTVTVRFREEGAADFSQGLPLFRVPAGNNAGFSWDNKHSGSVFGLKPGTTYEVELTLVDPDGGDATETLTVSTRSIPTEAANANLVEVSPDSIGDALSDASPGDVLVLANGTYDSIQVTRDGTAERPIVLRAAELGGAVVEGEVRLDGRSFVYVEGLEVHGRFKLNDSESIMIRGCSIITEQDGIVSLGSGVTNGYFVDNVISGATEWNSSALGVDGDNVGEGIWITGAGNVVAFNRVSGFRDCISLLEGGEAVDQMSIDIYGNDLSACADDAVEADYSLGNVRVYQNRIAQSFMGISSQPSLGGPTYFIRNVMYNVIYEAFKLHNGTVGDVGYHNTIVKSGDAFAVYTGDVVSRAHFVNNLFLGGPGGVYGGYDSGDGAVIELVTADSQSYFDYNGYGSIGTGEFAGRLGDARFSSLDELREDTTEANAIEVDLSIFAETVAFPEDPFGSETPSSLELAEGAAALDQGVVLPSINDGFSGDGPDLGAHERGHDLPVYGPNGSVVPGGSGGSGGTSSNTSAATSSGGGGDAGGDGSSSASAGDSQGNASQSSGSSSESAASSNSATNGASNSSGSSNGSGGSSSDSPNSASGSDDEGGCGCRVSGARGSASSYWLALVLFGLLRRRRG